jgi:hypothetical protein
MIRAVLTENLLQLTVDIRIVRTDDEGHPVSILLPLSEGVTYAWDDVEPGVMVRPTLSLGHMEARAVLDALHAHYGGVDDQRMLRKDYDAERARVDKLADALVQVALGNHQPGTP